MLAEPKLKSLSELVSDLNREELIWVNDYLTRLVSTANIESSSAKQNIAQQRITIAFGTETGNAQRLANHFATKAKQRGLLVKLVGLDQYRLNDLPREKYFFTIISTQGEGEPPIGAKKFYDHILASGPELNQLQFAVLALGDTAYPMFCKTGEEVDEQFEQLGGKRLLPLQKCDLDYEQAAEQWMNNVIAFMQSPGLAAPAETAIATPLVKEKPAGRQIYEGTILSKINLNASGSSKRTYHFEIAAENVSYITGDSIAITPNNPAEMVSKILTLTNTDPAKNVTWKTETFAIETLLTQKLNISFLSDKSVGQFENICGQTVAERKTSLLALIQKYPVSESQLENIITHLNPIAPRIYNIASAPSVFPGEVHITLLEEHYQENGEKQTGVCTQFLEGKEEGDLVSFFIQTNKRFRLPVADKDVIMISQGTGIAPFRSFVAERDATGATGRNWLFFGEENFTSDFLYQTEWQQFFNTGVLTNVSLAFTNGEPEPFLIQQKLKQQAAAFYEWIQQGAFVYLCGEKEPMGKEVEATIIEILKEQGKLEEKEALDFFDQLKKEGRFIKDLY